MKAEMFKNNYISIAIKKKKNKPNNVSFALQDSYVNVFNSSCVVGFSLYVCFPNTYMTFLVYNT